MVRLRTEGPLATAANAVSSCPSCSRFITSSRRAAAIRNRPAEPFRLREDLYPPVFHREEHGQTYYRKALGNLYRFNRHIREEAGELL